MSQDLKFPICHRCKKEIEDVAYIAVSPAIILQKFFTQTPPIFKCKEQAENYSKQMIFHDDCWMDELKDHSVELHDIKALIQEFAKKELEALASSSSSSSSSSESKNDSI